MPSFVTVYCQRSVAHVDDAALEHLIRDTYLVDMVEILDLPEGEEAAVDALYEDLRVQNHEIEWQPGKRPIQISVYDGGECRAHIAELLEELPDDDGPGATRVRAHLASCVEIVYLEMGLNALETLASVLAEVVSRHYADEGQGLVCFYDHDWRAPDHWDESLWHTAE